MSIERVYFRFDTIFTLPYPTVTTAILMHINTVVTRQRTKVLPQSNLVKLPLYTVFVYSNRPYRYGREKYQCCTLKLIFRPQHGRVLLKKKKNILISHLHLKLIPYSENKVLYFCTNERAFPFSRTTRGSRIIYTSQYVSFVIIKFISLRAFRKISH